MARLTKVAAALTACLLLRTGPAGAQTHPMDALSADEIKSVAEVLKLDARLPATRVQLITVLEPAKAEVLSWKPGGPFKRRARVTAVAGPRVLEIAVDIARPGITDLTAITAVTERPGVEAPITLNEFTNGVNVALEHPGFLAALKKRGVRNQDLVVWVNLGMHHLTRAEDSPVMPTLWHSFRLRPFNFFDRNPAVDLRTEFAR